jgi:hypothetical protein
MKAPINILHSTTGAYRIENQTRYDSHDLLALVNWIEAQFASGTNRRPYGTVLQFVDWRTSATQRNLSKLVNGKWVTATVPNWVKEYAHHDWNVIRVVPPDRLFTNCLEALGWDGKEAPATLVEMIAQRVADEIIPVNQNRQMTLEKMPTFTLRVNEKRGSRRRGADMTAARASVMENKLNKARSKVGNGLWYMKTSATRMRQVADGLHRVDPKAEQTSNHLRRRIEELHRGLYATYLEMIDLQTLLTTTNYTGRN